jgi:hypothetical protein
LLIKHTPTIRPIKSGGKIPDINQHKKDLSEKHN